MYRDAMIRGDRVSIEACPGGGKTHILLESSIPDALFLAYNNQLAAKIKTMLEHGTCVTFHALCGRCLEVVRDDHQLEDVVKRAEAGTLVPHNIPACSCILLDEAQDVRKIYVRLLRVLGLLCDSMPMLVAGDRNQLVYDFCPDFPATLDTLTDPESTFGGGWSHDVLDESKRLTRPMCEVVNAIFDTSIRSSKDGPLVDLYAPKTQTQVIKVVRHVLATSEGEVLLLVDRKKGNRTLRTLLNILGGVDGTDMRIHGIDEDDGDECRLRCGSFWSCKGLQSTTVVVMLPGAAARNPTYVALTRASHRLVILMDPKEPHAALCSVASSTTAADSIAFGPDIELSRALTLGASKDKNVSLSRREFPNSTFRNLDNWEPCRSAFLEHATFTTLEDGDVVEDENTNGFRVGAHDVARIVPLFALVAAEIHTGVVRGMEDIINPTRMQYDQFRDAIRSGLSCRWIPRFVSDEALLSADLRVVAVDAYSRLQGEESTLRDVAEVTLAIDAWDDFDHRMRSLRPVHIWASHPHCKRAISKIRATIPTDAQYDVRKCVGDTHVRFHAWTEKEAYHVVWDTTSFDRSAAAVRAAMHPRGCCILVDLSNNSVVKVEASSRLLAQS